MKHLFVALLFISIVYKADAQDINPTEYSTLNLSFEVIGPKSNPIKKEALQLAKTLVDINAGYPSKWVSNYISVEIIAVNDGESVRAEGANDVINTQQKSILNAADHGSEIQVNVKYKSQNATTKIYDEEEMKFSMSVVPELQAVYASGKENMNKYIKENGMDLIISKKKMASGSIKFTIAEDGSIENPIISKETGHEDIDKILLDLITKMPKWNPAKTIEGKNIKQEFEFRLSNNGC
jgi:hypothetical protein